MKLVAITACLNEDDIIEAWLRHTLSEGVDHIYIEDGGSTDDTRIIIESIVLESHSITLLDHYAPTFDQAARMNLLSRMAYDEGADWIIAADVDEFFYATDGRTIRSRLQDVDDNVHKLYCKSYQHHDWTTRQVEPKRLPKVVYRAGPDITLAFGNHECSAPSGVYDVMDLRELQYRGFDHFCAKTRSRNETLHASARARGDGWHYTRMEGFNDDEMRREWDAMLTIPTTHSPIPSHLPQASSYLSLEMQN